MRRMYQSQRAWVTLVLAAVLAAGCSGNPADDPEDSAEQAEADAEPTGVDPRGDASLTFRLSEAPGSIDPHTETAAATGEVVRYVYDTLLNMTPEGEVVSGLAEEWEISPDSATFVLRDDVTCSDGSQLTATTVAENFLRLKDPDTAAPYVTNRVGSNEYEVSWDDDERTVTLELPKPFFELEFWLTSYPRIVCDAGLEDPDQLTNNAIGTGPFTLAELVAGDHYRFEKREGYAWGPDGATTDIDGFPSEITLQVVENETTATNMFMAGELNLLRIRGQERERVESADLDGVTTRENPIGVVMVVFNHDEGRPAAEQDVRRGLALALDRDAMTQASVGRFGAVASSLHLPGQPCYEPSVGESIAGYDLEQARDLLLDAPTVKVLAGGAGGEWAGAGPYALEAWREAGVDVDYQTPEYGAFLETVFSGGDWDVVVTTANGIQPPGGMHPWWAGPTPHEGGQNITFNNNELYEEQAQQARQDAGSVEESCGFWNDAERTLHEQVDAVYPVSHTSDGWYGRDLDFDIASGALVLTSLRAE